VDIICPETAGNESMKTLYKVKKSTIHGLGVCAAMDVKKNTPIIQYVGEYISKRQSEKLALATQDLIYVFELNDKQDINGDVPWNDARYINHSCSPNCYTELRDNEIWIVADRDIEKGEELSYDYGFARSNWAEQPCYCGTKACFHFIVNQKYWKAIGLTKKYQKLIAAVV
jgi:uncharacterized protein